MKKINRILAFLLVITTMTSTAFAAEIYDKKYCDIVNVTEYFEESGIYTSDGEEIEAYVGQDYLEIALTKDVKWVDFYLYEDEEFYLEGINTDDDLVDVDFSIVMAETGEVYSSYKYFKLIESGEIDENDGCFIRAGSVITVYGIENGENTFACNIIYDDEKSHVFIGIVYDYEGNASEETEDFTFDDVNEQESVEIVTGTAKVTSAKVFVDGEEIAFDAFEINDNNYFKLRDLAMAFSDTDKKFEVNWDEEAQEISLFSAQNYTKVGGELEIFEQIDAEYATSIVKIYKDDVAENFEVYEICDNNYFKLRDICQAFDIGVIWDEATQTIYIDTGVSYEK